MADVVLHPHTAAMKALLGEAHSKSGAHLAKVLVEAIVKGLPCAPLVSFFGTERDHMRIDVASFLDFMDWRLLWRFYRQACLGKAVGRRSRSKDRRDCRVQGRPADKVAGRLRQARRAIRRTPRLLHLGDPSFQHHDQHGTAHSQHAAFVRAVRARDYGRAHPGQSRRFKEEGHLDGRRGSIRLSGGKSRASHR